MNTIKQNIGHKKRYLLYAISILLIGIFLFYSLLLQIRISNSDRILWTFGFSFVFGLVVCYWLLTMLSPTCSYWTIDNTSLSVGYSNFKERLLAFKKKKHPLFSIRLRMIHSVKIEKDSDFVGKTKAKYHSITITIETYDGSLTTFKVLEAANTKTFYPHIKHLEDIGVTIIDADNIIKEMEESEVQNND